MAKIKMPTEKDWELAAVYYFDSDGMAAFDTSYTFSITFDGSKWFICDSEDGGMLEEDLRFKSKESAYRAAMKCLKGLSREK